MWYYRLPKVILLILPPVIALVLLLRGTIAIPQLTQKNIEDILQNNANYIVYVVLGVVAYYVVLNILWRGAIYLIYGGLEDDTRPATTQGPAMDALAAIPIIIIILVALFAFVLYELNKQTNGESILPKSRAYGTACTSKGKNGIYGNDRLCYTCSSGSASTRSGSGCSGGQGGVYCCTGSTPPKCIPTGCEPGWYCSGYYYLDNQRINVPGLCLPAQAKNIYPSWSGTCRQCP